MAKFSDYLDKYPGALPGDFRTPVVFGSPSDQGSFFEKFLALQSNPTSVLMQKINLPDKFKQFMNIGGIQ